MNEEHTDGGAGPSLGPAYALAFVVTLSYGAIFALLAEFRERFGLGESQVGLIAAAGFGGAFVAHVTLSRFADRGHVRLMLRCGVTVAALSMLAIAFGESFPVLLVARATLGLATGSMIPALRRLVISADPENVGANIGRFGAFDVAGFMFGPIIGTVLHHFFGLRAPFLVLGALVALMYPAVARLDMGSAPLATAETPPVRALLKNRGIQSGLLVASGFFGMIGAFDAMWAVQLTDLGASTLMIGVIIFILVAPMIVLSPLGGRLAQERGPLRLVAFGFMIAVPCVAAYGFAGSVGVIVIIAMLQVFGDAFTFPANQVVIAQSSPPDQLASAQGLLGAVEVFMGLVASIFAGVIYERWGARPVWLTIAGYMALVLVLAIARSPELMRRPEERSTQLAG